MSDKRTSFLWTHDLLVVVVAGAVLAISWLAYGAITKPARAEYREQGLTFDYPRGWLPSRASDSAPGGLPVHAWLQPVDEPLTRLEVRIENKPAAGVPLQSVLELSRIRAFGQLYQQLSSDELAQGGKTWRRTRFSYAYKPTPDDAPRVATAVELAAVNGDLLYVVTLHGEKPRVDELEAELLDTIDVE